MAYIPNATDTAEPVESQTVESAALEFRTLKASVNGRLSSLQAELDAEEVARAAGDSNLQAQLGLETAERIGADSGLNTRLSGIETLVAAVGTGPVSNANSVVFQPAGTGAVATTVQGKLRESVSIKDFGAKGDGFTDDTAAFTSAMSNGKMYSMPFETKYTFLAPLENTGAGFFPNPAMTWSAITDSGKLDILRGANTSSPKGATIWRFSDRVFIGEAAAKFAGDSAGSDGGNSWFNSTDHARYLGINASCLTVAKNNSYGVVSAVKTSNTGNHSIAFGAYAMADHYQKTTWGYIAELNRKSGAWYAFGLEVAAKNQGSNGELTPNGTATTGVYGIWLAGGGDDNFGGAPTNPSTCGIVILKNSHTWNTGICFQRDALTSGEAISLSSEAVNGSHTIRWYNAAGNTVFNLKAGTTTDTEQWTLERYNGGINISAEGASLFSIGKAASAVNGFTCFAAATGGAPNLSASGTDANIDLRLSGKGTGILRFGTWASAAAPAVNGYVTIKDSAGNIRKLATIA